MRLQASSLANAFADAVADCVIDQLSFQKAVLLASVAVLLQLLSSVAAEDGTSCGGVL